MPYFEWKARNLDIKYYDQVLASAGQAQASRWLMQNSIDVELGVIEANSPDEAVLILAQRGLVPTQVIKINYEQYRIAKKVQDKIEFFKNRLKPKPAPEKKKKCIPLGYYALSAIVGLQLLLLIYLLAQQ